jgi:hypothetical protein
MSAHGPDVNGGLIRMPLPFAQECVARKAKVPVAKNELHRWQQHCNTRHSIASVQTRNIPRNIHETELQLRMLVTVQPRTGQLLVQISRGVACEATCLAVLHTFICLRPAGRCLEAGCA